MKTTLYLVFSVLFCAGTLFAAKYVDPLNGNDLNAGSDTAPWKTLANINSIVDTVYVSNSAVCLFVNNLSSRTPYDLTLLPWGDQNPSRDNKPVILISNLNTACTMTSTSCRRLLMRNLLLVFSNSFSGTPRLFDFRNSGMKTCIVEECEFDFNSTSGSAIDSILYVQNTSPLLVRFSSNLVYGTIGGYVIKDNPSPLVVDVRYNRFFNFRGTGTRGICYFSTNIPTGVIANNTAYGCKYLCWANFSTATPGVTNVNNIMFNKVSGDYWLRAGGSLPNQSYFADFNYSGNTVAETYQGGVIGLNNSNSQSNAQINFKNTTDVANAQFLMTDQGSVAAVSGAATMYPELNLPSYAGWAPTVPEPLLLVALAYGLGCLYLLRR